MHVAFLGFGLINGSIALALRRAGGWTIAAWSPSGTGPRDALARGVIDSAPARLELALAGADLVVLGAPPTACLTLLDRLATARGALAPGAVITDVASTKEVLVAHALALRLRFVGGHPMAGRETTGFAAATWDLFVGRPWVIVAERSADGLADDEAAARVEVLATATGALAVRMGGAVHDRAVAAISHLPLLVSVALVEAIAGGAGEISPDGWPVAASLAAGGWHGVTRLARGDAAMAAGIFTTNARELAAALRTYQARLAAWLDRLEAPGGPDEQVMRERLEAARNRLESAETQPREQP